MKIEPYQAYKDSGVEWLGVIPEHWETLAVKRVAKAGYKKFVDGDWIESPYITDKGIRLIQTGNVGIGIYKEKGWRYISEKTFNDLNCTEIFPDDILICRLDGPVGRACLVPDLQVRMITSVDNAILKPSEDFDSQFIVYVMSSSVWLEWIQTLCRVGGGFRFRISRSMLGELIIQKPPFFEQKTIAHYLDTKTAQIDRKINLLTQKATLYSNLKQSLINETVTRGLDKTAPMKNSGIDAIGEVPTHWTISRIKNLGILSRGVDLPREDFVEGIFPVYGSNGIIGYHSNYTTKAPCLTVGRSGSVGEINYVSEDFWAHNTALYLQQSFNSSIKFIFYLFKSLNLQSFSAGSAVGTLNRNIIHQLKIAIPPASEQKAIADYLDTKTAQIDQIIQTINTQIERLKELRKTLINDVVTGKIKVVENEH